MNNYGNRCKACLCVSAVIVVSALANTNEAARCHLTETPERRAGTKEAFYITPEERSRVKLFDEDCVISEFTNAVNKAVNDTSRKKLQAKTINDWLVNEGYLINSTDANGRTRRELTERSAEIGISSKQGINALGSYTIILYSRRAQEFILENIDKII